MSDSGSVRLFAPFQAVKTNTQTHVQYKQLCCRQGVWLWTQPRPRWVKFDFGRRAALLLFWDPPCLESRSDSSATHTGLISEEPRKADFISSSSSPVTETVVFPAREKNQIQEVWPSSHLGTRHTSGTLHHSNIWNIVTERLINIYIYIY